MLDKTWLLSSLIFLVIVQLGQQDETKDGNTKETAEYLIEKMAKALYSLYGQEDRKEFMKNCGIGKKYCTLEAVGGSSGINWTVGISEESKAHFWSSYKCFAKRKVSICPVNGGWTLWSNWDECVAKCGDLSEIKRFRECENPLPENFGNHCEGHRTQKRLCKGQCNESGKNLKSQLEALAFIERLQHKNKSLADACYNQHCTYEELGKIIAKPEIKDKYWSSLQCYKYHRACPVDGIWSGWSEWSQCSPDCGDGVKHRTRDCSNPPATNAGYRCMGEMYQEKACVGYKCKKNAKIRPLLSEWSEFSPCSKKCGKYGTMAKFRDCLSPAECARKLNLTTDTKLTIEKPCFNGACPKILKWSGWSAYTESSAVCGKGRSVRFRTCNLDRPVNGGVCEGNSTQRRPKNGDCTEAALKQFQTARNNSKEGNVNETTADLPPIEELILKPLNASLENLYTTWTLWSKCSKSCLSGIRERFRHCKQSRGLKCKGEIWQIQPCNMVNCPVNGGWSQWETWTICSTTCGTDGIRKRYRRCDQPYSSFGGMCIGVNEEASACPDIRQCDTRIGYDAWSSWSACSKSCDTGEKIRRRQCNLPKINNTKIKNDSEKYCSASETVGKTICNAVMCPIDGNWANWNSWSPCSGGCGIQHHYRDRSCTDPAPKYNGKSCFGPGSEIMTCFKVPCSALTREGISMKNGYLLYRKRGKPTGYFSLYLQFKSRSDEHGRILQHKYDGCTTDKTCKSSIEISIKKRKLNVSVKHADSVVNLVTQDDSVQKDNWHSIYLHLADDQVFLRVDDDKKYNKSLTSDSKVKINFDGYMKIGNFTGIISSVRVNTKEYSFKRLNRHRFTSPQKASKNNEVVKFLPDSKDAVVGYSVFRGNSFIKIPIKDNKRLNMEIVFFPTSPNGIIMFNRGKVPGSYIYLVIWKDTLKFCMSDSKNKTCEDILDINVYKWYHVGINVDNKRTEIRVNKANAVQMTFTEEDYIPVGNLCIGGGEKPDNFVFLMVVGFDKGFQGVIHEIVINGQKYEIYPKPLINDRGVLSSLGINNPERRSEIYEHQNSAVKLYCDYTQYATMKQYNTSVEWFKEDTLLKPDGAHHINHKIPGDSFISQLTLLPSKSQTGLYACAIVVDGIYTVSHLFVLIRHDIVIVYPAVEEEEVSLEIFLIVVLITLVFGLGFVLQYKLKVIQRTKLEGFKKVLVTAPQDGPPTGTDEEKLPTDETGEIADTTLDTSGQADETDGLDTTGQTDELDTTGQTDELDTTGQTDELDTTGQTNELESSDIDSDEEVEKVVDIEDNESDEDVVHFDRQKSSHRNTEMQTSSPRQMRQASKGSVHWDPRTQSSGGALMKSSIMKPQSSSQYRQSSSGITPQPPQPQSLQYRPSSSGTIPQPQSSQYRPISPGIIPQPPRFRTSSSNITPRPQLSSPYRPSSSDITPPPRLSSQNRPSSSAMRQLPSMISQRSFPPSMPSLGSTSQQRNITEEELQNSSHSNGNMAMRGSNTTPQYSDNIPHVRSSRSPPRILPSSRNISKRSLHSSLPEPPSSLARSSQDSRIFNRSLHSSLPAPPSHLTQTSQDFRLNEEEMMLSAPRGSSFHRSPRILPSPISPSRSDDEISVHSLLSINHKSTSKIEHISLSSSHDEIMVKTEDIVRLQEED